MTGIKEKYKKYAVSMAAPRIEKVVVNVGTGKVRDSKEIIETIIKHTALITGQKLSPRQAKKAISSFKTREGMIVGYKATLRGGRMYDFLERLIHLTIPRMRDFRGISLKSVDRDGNLTLGIKEHIVFPEVIEESLKNIFGLEVTVVTNTRDRDAAIRLFRELGFPLEKHV